MPLSAHEQQTVQSLTDKIHVFIAGYDNLNTNHQGSLAHRLENFKMNWMFGATQQDLWTHNHPGGRACAIYAHNYKKFFGHWSCERRGGNTKIMCERRQWKTNYLSPKLASIRTLNLHDYFLNDLASSPNKFIQVDSPQFEYLFFFELNKP